MLNLFGLRKDQIKPVVLLVLDGFGIAPPSEGNAIFRAKTPHYNRFLKTYPYAELIASGESVGLPANEVGNTEVGHLTLGAGRVMYQDLVRIQHAIKDNSIYENPALLGAMAHVRKHQSKLHIMGLLSSGNVHASREHLYALIEMVKLQRVSAYFHVILDGRDADPKEGLLDVEDLELRIEGVGKIATVTGRYYAMDRDRRWDRTQLAYDAMTIGNGEQASSAAEAIKRSYERNETDEFIKPTNIIADGKPIALVGDNDAGLFYNFRVDRPKQLAAALVVPQFESLTNFDFERTGVPAEFEATFQRQKKPVNLFFVTMTEYHKGLPVSAMAFGPEIVENSLPEYLSAKGYTQLQMAESEKERFVTFYFNGMREGGYPNIEVKIVPSAKVATYDLKPEMSVFELVKEFKKRIDRGGFQFGVMNFANADMVGHTGNLEKTIEAVEYLDKALGEMEKLILKHDGLLIITADHGNAEELIRYQRTSFFYTSEEGDTDTAHSNNKVPGVFISNQFRGLPTKLSDGTLSDIAPTLLSYMGLPIAEGMTGRDLLGQMNIHEKQLVS